MHLFGLSCLNFTEAGVEWRMLLQFKWILRDQGSGCQVMDPDHWLGWSWAHWSLSWLIINCSPDDPSIPPPILPFCCQGWSLPVGCNWNPSRGNKCMAHTHGRPGNTGKQERLTIAGISSSLAQPAKILFWKTNLKSFDCMSCKSSVCPTAIPNNIGCTV